MSSSIAVGEISANGVLGKCVLDFDWDKFLAPRPEPETCKCGRNYTIHIEYKKNPESEIRGPSVTEKQHNNVFFCWACNQSRIEKLELEVEKMRKLIGSLAVDGRPTSSSC